MLGERGYVNNVFIPDNSCNLSSNKQNNVGSKQNTKRTQSLSEKILCSIILGQRKEKKQDISQDVQKSSDVPDGNWGWLIVFSSFFIQFIVIGFDGCSGTLYLKFKDKFKTSALITAWLGSLATALRLFLGPLASALSNRFSERTVIMTSGVILCVSMILTGLATNIYYVFLSFGILGGIGRSLAYCPAIVMVGTYFNKKQGIATGIAASGCGVGKFALTLLVAYLFTQYDFLDAFIIMGGIALEVVVFGALMRPLATQRHIIDTYNRKKIKEKQTESNNNSDVLSVSISILEKPLVVKNCCDAIDSKNKENAKIFDFSILKDLRFFGFCITMLLSSMAEQSAFVFLPAFSQEIGVLGDNSSEYTIAITSVFNTLAKVLAGFVFDCSAVTPYRVYLYNGLMSGLALMSFVIPSVTTFPQLAVACALYGLFAGSYSAQKSVVVVDILGRDKLVHSYGILMMFQGIGTFLGPPLSGLFKDINGKYNVAFYIGGIGMLVGCLIMLVNNVVHFVNTRTETKKVLSYKICSYVERLTCQQYRPVNIVICHTDIVPKHLRMT